jgi:hypothetical protein
MANQGDWSNRGDSGEEVVEVVGELVDVIGMDGGRGRLSVTTMVISDDACSAVEALCHLVDLSVPRGAVQAQSV